MTLTPAYGRDYTSQKAVKADFDADKDFMIADMSSPWNGKPANKTDLTGSVTSVWIRYNKLEKIVEVKL